MISISRIVIGIAFLAWITATNAFVTSVSTVPTHRRNGFRLTVRNRPNSGKPFGGRTLGRKSRSSQNDPKVSNAVENTSVRHGKSSDSPLSTKVIVKKQLTVQNIMGQNIVHCRPFSLSSVKSFEFLGSYTDLSTMPSYAIPEIAFVGRSNVGKSSLLNTISGQHKTIAVEGKQPGRTQLMNQFLCSDNRGEICIFTDLPGYGYAKISKEKQDQISKFVNVYLKGRGSLKLTFVLVDARREPQASDYEMIQLLNEIGENYAVVATKVDKLTNNEASVSLTNLRNAFHLPDIWPIRFSSVTGEGKRDVWQTAKDAMLNEGIFAMDDDDNHSQQQQQQQGVENKTDDNTYGDDV